MSLRRFLCNITAVAPVLVAEFDWIEKNQAIFEVSSADPARFTKETLYIQKALMAASSSRRSSGDVVEASRRALGHLRRASGALAHLGRHCLPPTHSGRRLGSPAITCARWNRPKRSENHDLDQMCKLQTRLHPPIREPTVVGFL